jgi:NADH dehydrogenase [ubiquinone] 1 alpha subcomplex assembly factor 7
VAHDDGKGPARARRADRGQRRRFVTPLERALCERIRVEGPITVEAFMEACNTFYYGTRDPFGQCGDFTTAPEISQMFGEMIGAALADVWRRSRAPEGVIYAELGPGRGTLAADALRVLRSFGFAGEVHLVETSPALREVQETALPMAHWHEKIAELPQKPLLLVANEFLDALPVRQFVGSVERRIQVVGGKLAFDRDGEIFEDSPARGEAVAAIAEHLVEHGGVAIIIDYGHLETAPGDTLQAVRSHAFVPVLEHPGEQDLTAHVDFDAVGRAAQEAGAAVTRIRPQGEWLLSIGIQARARSLSASNPSRSEEIEASLQRLTAAGEMGTLFKVMAIHSPEWQPPAGL